jgi:hypothetical protein
MNLNRQKLLLWRLSSGDDTKFSDESEPTFVPATDRDSEPNNSPDVGENFEEKDGAIRLFL